MYKLEILNLKIDHIFWILYTNIMIFRDAKRWSRDII